MQPKFFPGVIPPDPVKKGREGRGEGEGRERKGRGGPQFTFLATPLKVRLNLFMKYNI